MSIFFQVKLIATLAAPKNKEIGFLFMYCKNYY
jgi:hypothetical protein